MKDSMLFGKEDNIEKDEPKQEDIDLALKMLGGISPDFEVRQLNKGKIEYAESGINCPKCGSYEYEILSIYFVAKSVSRIRRCLNCGLTGCEYETIEKLRMR